MHKLNDNEVLEDEGIINENEILKPLLLMDKDKTQRIDNITKKFYVKFSEFFKKPRNAMKTCNYKINKKKQKKKIGIKGLKLVTNLSFKCRYKTYFYDTCFLL